MPFELQNGQHGCASLPSAIFADFICHFIGFEGFQKNLNSGIGSSNLIPRIAQTEFCFDF
jgi:hypothetical protein